MIRAAIILSLSSTLLAGCDQLGSKENPEEQLDAVMRLARAPTASDAFLKRNSMMECRAKMKNFCTAKGCEEGTVNVTQHYDVKSNHYQRSIDSTEEKLTKNTESVAYNPTIKHSGIWFNFEFPQGGMLFRVNTLGDFTEVVTENDLTIIYSGSCQFK